MSLKRKYKGIEGYFYNSGNLKLNIEPGVIDKCWYQNEAGYRGLNIGVLRNEYTSFAFKIRDKKDISDFLREFDVRGIRELMKLPAQERLVLVYNRDGVNYGISLNRGFIGGRPKA
jgi:hypothetical protein